MQQAKPFCEIDILRLRFVSREGSVDLLLERFIAELHSTLLLERDGGVLVLDQVTITLGLGPSTILHRGARRGVVAELDGFQVGWGDLRDSIVNFDGFVALLVLMIEPAQLVQHVQVFRIVFEQCFHREDCNFRVIRGDGGIFQEHVRLRVIGGGFEHFLDQLDCFSSDPFSAPAAPS